MATKKTWEWARRKALLAYRKALKAAEKGDWREARRLTERFAGDCAFCEVFSRLFRSQKGQEDVSCFGRCPAEALCQRRHAPWNAVRVLRGQRTPAAGLRHFRLTIAQLEALDV